MFKKLLIISICATIGIFFTSLVLSQDDPSTTEPEKTEKVTDDSKKELKDETKPAEPVKLDTEGPHTIRYYGIDKVGNKEPDKAYRVVVDNTGPVIVVTTSAPVKKVVDKIYFTKNILFSVTTND